MTFTERIAEIKTLGSPGEVFTFKDDGGKTVRVTILAKGQVWIQK